MKTKIRLRNGRIYTLSVTHKSDSHIYGTDKFNQEVIIPISLIDSMFPIGEN